MKARLVLTSLSELSSEEIVGGVVIHAARGHPEERSPTEEPSSAGFEALPDESARFRKDLLRRYEEPYPIFWIHGGLNE